MIEQGSGRPLSPRLGLLLAMVGGGALVVAVVSNRNAMQMLPGMDGSLVAGVLAALLPLLHGLRYRAAVALMLPVIAMQIVACRAGGLAFLPILGPELMVVGIIGMLPLPWRESAAPAAAPAAAASPAEPRRSRSRHLISSTAG
jgi:hypothetical protein